MSVPSRGGECACLSMFRVSMRPHMNPERWKTIEETYHAALAQPASARSDVLEKTCGDDIQLRGEVECLLEESGYVEKFMESQTGWLAGQKLNHYEIGQLVGTGGMAEVYRARDTRLERDVAVKIL